MSRRWIVLILFIAVAGAAISRMEWFRPPRAGADPLPVPSGDEEIAWLHNPTAFESWENFVWGAKRAEMAGDGPDGLIVDDSSAYPTRTTDVPEVVIRRTGSDGNLRIRWYKVTNQASQEAWVNALARRERPPIAVMGGWSSDRAKELADAMREANWSAQRPLLFIISATADGVLRPADNYPPGYSPPQLISIYDRTFRFCFTNKQMAEAVTDYVFTDPTLRPGSVILPGLRAVASAASGIWPTLASFSAPHGDGSPLPAFAIAWEDDDYSIDLSRQFRTEIGKRSGIDGAPRLETILDTVPFSVGRLNRPNAREAAIADQILKQLPPPGTRSLIVIPTVSAPARRTLRALVQGNPMVGRQLVAVNGDGIGVNTFFRDREFAWPVRSLPIPVVLFTHADPFAWDTPGIGAAPPRDYELVPPPPGGVRSSTEDVQHHTRVVRIITAAIFPDGTGRIAPSADTLAASLRARKPEFFDEAGNRLSGTGEHVVVLRPPFPGVVATSGRSDTTGLEVFERHDTSRRWKRLHPRNGTLANRGNPQ